MSCEDRGSNVACVKINMTLQLTVGRVASL